MRSTAPEVSVLLPVRDGGTHLYESLESLVSQTFEDFEIVVVDDGSEDETEAVLEEWAKQDERIVPLRQRAQGIVVALEHAREVARGRYVARMDADDIALPERLARQHALMESRNDLVGCGCLVEYFPREALRDGALRYERWINGSVSTSEVASALFVECPLAHPTFFLRAAALDAVGGYRDRGWPEDYDLLLRLWASGGALAKVPEVLLRWRDGSERLSRVDPRYSPDAFLECKVHHLERTLLEGGRPVVVWGSGPVGKTMSRGLRRVGIEVEAFVDLDPRKIGQEIHDAPVLDTAAALDLRGPFHLASVGQEGARERIVTLLEGAGFEALRDFVAVA